MVDVSGLNAEQFEDFAAGLSFAIRTLKEQRENADEHLLRKKAASYEEYLQKFYKVQAYDEVIADLETLKTRRKESI